MLAHLFSSRTRVKLLSIFLLHSEDEYYVRELTRMTSEQINSIRRELDNLENIGLLESKKVNNKKYYFLNHDFLIIDELKGIFNKLADDRYDIIHGISQYGEADLVAISGHINNNPEIPCQMVIVGNFQNRDNLKTFLAGLEMKYKKVIEYVIFDRKEFVYRHRIHDKFLSNFFLSTPIVLIDKLKLHW